MNNNNLYDIDNWKLSDYLSTGSKWRDSLIGGVTGLGSSGSSKFSYVPISSWRGNGLADTRMQLMMNPKYRDYDSAGRAIAKIAQLGNRHRDNTLFNGESILDRPNFNSVLPQAISNATRSNNVGLFNDNASLLSNDYLSAIPNSITDSMNGRNTGSDLFSNLGNYTSVDMPYSIW